MDMVVLGLEEVYRMKPYDEQAAMENLRKLRRLALRIKDQDLLEVLARDDQPNNSREPDPFHRAVDTGVCQQLEKAAHALQNAVNIVAHLLDKAPAKGRNSTLDDCLACSTACIPRAIKGLCGDCLAEYERDRASWQSHGDYVAWKRAHLAGEQNDQ